MKQLCLFFVQVLLLTFGACDSIEVEERSVSDIDSTAAVSAKNLETVIEFDDGVSIAQRQEILQKITKKYLMGQFDPSKDKRFVTIPAAYASKQMYMRKEALEAFVKMHRAAKEGYAGHTHQ